MKTLLALLLVFIGIFLVGSTLMGPVDNLKELMYIPLGVGFMIIGDQNLSHEKIKSLLGVGSEDATRYFLINYINDEGEQGIETASVEGGHFFNGDNFCRYIENDRGFPYGSISVKSWCEFDSEQDIVDFLGGEPTEE